jgi:hypothetical protein
MKNRKVITILLSIFYFVFCIFVIFHNAGMNIDRLFSGKYLVFLGISIIVFFVLMKIIQEMDSNENNNS